MTIKEAILARLSDGEASMLLIDDAVTFRYGVRSTAASVRARVYSLMKAGKVRRVRRGVYALVETRTKKTQATA